jgi:arylsulfatase A-like enzyme
VKRALGIAAFVAAIVAMAYLAMEISTPGSDPPTFDKPNIIVLYTDDQRWDTLDYMPAVGRLAEEGVVFTNSFVTAPVCGPSRASLLTGRLASRQGITRNEGASGQFDPSDTIAVKLRERGYVTALFGKYLNGYRDQFPKVPPGWSEWRVFRDRLKDLFSARSLYVDPVFSWNGRRRREIGYSTDLLGDYAVEFIEEHADRPFFLLLSFWAAHVPLHPADRHQKVLWGKAPERPSSFEEEGMSEKPSWLREAARGVDLDQIWEYAWPRYLETLLSVDEAVASIRSKLEELGLEQNTIIVFTSDNGFLFGEHWYVGKGVPYEESIRVPLVVWNPRIGHREVDKTVLNVDIAPTLAQLAGTEIDSDGHSILPLLFGSDAPSRRCFEIEWEEGFRLPEAYDAVRCGLFKYVKWHGGHRELYILPFDPREEHGVGVSRGDPPDREARGKGRARARRRVR